MGGVLTKIKQKPLKRKLVVLDIEVDKPAVGSVLYYKQKKESENRLTNKEKKVSTLISQEINELSKDLTNEEYAKKFVNCDKIFKEIEAEASRIDASFNKT